MTRYDALRIRGVSKCFNRPAVSGLDLTIGAGEFYGLLGPNGAGKTTTLRMVVGLLQPDLAFIAGLWRMDAGSAERRGQELLERLDLWENRNERCEGFSRGMKQKAALAGALLHDPKLLILDEPLTGLDAAIARQVKDLLLDRARQGCTVILTTHILDVAERLVDRIGVIQSGRLLAQGTLDELRLKSGRKDSTLEDVFLHLVTKPRAEAA